MAAALLSSTLLVQNKIQVRGKRENLYRIENGWVSGLCQVTYTGAAATLLGRTIENL